MISSFSRDCGARLPSATEFFAARPLPALETSCEEENSEIGSESGRSFLNPPGAASRLFSGSESSEISKIRLLLSA